VVLPTSKEVVSMRLDGDLLRWFRLQRRYHTRINAILRAAPREGNSGFRPHGTQKVYVAMRVLSVTDEHWSSS
jgi:hypothetical protein